MAVKGLDVWRYCIAVGASASFSLFAETGNISGTVTESSRQTALTGVEVKVEGQGIQASTDDSGHYVLLGVPAGAVKVTAQTLDQMSEATPLSLKNPPAMADIFVPACSAGAEGYACDWTAFRAAAMRAINADFVER